jgi:hypothetical protein
MERRRFCLCRRSLLKQNAFRRERFIALTLWQGASLRFLPNPSNRKTLYACVSGAFMAPVMIATASDIE